METILITAGCIVLVLILLFVFAAVLIIRKAHRTIVKTNRNLNRGFDNFNRW